MPLLIFRRCLCWKLITATFANLVTTAILSFGALLLRALDLGAFGSDDFEISTGFKTQWRSHQWQAFLASDIIVIFCHVVMILYTCYLIYMVTMMHFVLYVETLRTYTYCFIMYSFIEFCFSVFEWSFYGRNTFRLSYVVFIWLYWLARMLAHIGITVMHFSRIHEIEDEMASELRTSDRKYVHSYSVLG